MKFCASECCGDKLREKAHADPCAEPDAVGNKSDEFRISGSAAVSTAEEHPEIVPVSAVPGGFDGVADSPFYTGGRGVVLVGDPGVELLGDTAQQEWILNSEQDSGSEIMVAFYVGGDTEFLNGICYIYNSICLA